MFAKSDEIPSMSLQDIKERPKCCRWMDRKTDKKFCFSHQTSLCKCSIIYIVCVKCQIVSAKAVVRVDSPTHTLSMYQQNTFLKNYNGQ